MRNSRRLRNTLLGAAIIFAIAGVGNLLYVQVPGVTPPVNALAFVLFLMVAVLDWRATRRERAANTQA